MKKAGKRVEIQLLNWKQAWVFSLETGKPRQVIHLIFHISSLIVDYYSMRIGAIMFICWTIAWIELRNEIWKSSEEIVVGLLKWLSCFGCTIICASDCFMILHCSSVLHYLDLKISLLKLTEVPKFGSVR